MTLGPREALVVLHVIGNLVWIGSITAAGLLLGSKSGQPGVRAELSLYVYRRLAVPGFLLSFGAGVGRLLLDSDLYLVVTKYMHPKLFLAVVVIGLHHVIGARAKRMAKNPDAGAGPSQVLALLILLCAAAAAFLVITKPF